MDNVHFSSKTDEWETPLDVFRPLYAMKGTITFLRGRLKFGGHKNAAPFPSAIVVFGGEVKQAKENP